MQKMIKAFLILALFSFYSLSYSDNHLPDYSAMESFQCKFKDGKGMDDVVRVSDEWNKWIQESGNVSVQYNGWHIVPVLQNQKDFDFTHGWLGFTDNYEDLGTIQDEWLANGSKMQTKFDRVEDCSIHSFYYVYQVRAPKDPFTKGFMTVSGCNLSDEATNEDFFAADEKWNAYLDENNYSNSVLMRWAPGSGTGVDYPYDFLSVSVVPTFKDWGQNVDKLVTGGGAYQGSLYGNLGTCDTPRVYRVTYAGGYNPE